MTRAVFVSGSACMHANGPAGGVQICTNEYLGAINAAGYKLANIVYDADKRPATRVRRRLLGRRPYLDLLPPDLTSRIVGAACDAQVVFLNQVDFTPLAGELRRRLPKDCRLVLLSHGNESVDYLHMIRAGTPASLVSGVSNRDMHALGRMVFTECESRRHLDLVVCLAPFEMEIERWLGSRRVTWLPRTIPSLPLDWNPTLGRLGFVGTLNHSPNREGLELFLEALARSDPEGRIHLRLVGGPPQEAVELTRRFPRVEYLGPLPDPQLRAEAATWACFCHPLFCYSRGCSTKLAIGIGWGIPVLTTPAGHRGYEWRDGNLAVSDTPDGLAELALNATELSWCDEARRNVQSVAATSPSLDDIAKRLRHSIDGIGT